MTQKYQVHPENPQMRLLERAAEMLIQGGVAIIPTDSAYALVCLADEKRALDRIKQIKQLEDKHHFTLLCRDLSEIAVYAHVDNWAFRYLKSHTPGPYTFVLNATKQVPKRLQHPKKKTIGIRVPDCNVALMLLDILKQPMLSTTLILPGHNYPMTDPDVISDDLQKRVEVFIETGYGSVDVTSIIDLSGTEPVILREGLGADQL